MDWNDKQQVLQQVSKNGLFLTFASDDLKDDEEVVMTAIKENHTTWVNASPRLKDSEIVQNYVNNWYNYY